MDANSPIGNGLPQASHPAPISFIAAQRASRAYGAKVQAVAAQPSAKMPSNAQRLVAAVVPGKVDFSGSVPAAAPGAMPLYRNPADRNAAALSVEAGRSLDVTA